MRQVDHLSARRSLLLILLSLALPFLLVSLSVVFADAGWYPSAFSGWHPLGWLLLIAMVSAGLVPLMRLPWPYSWRLITVAIYLPMMGLLAFAYLLVFACAYTKDCV